MGDTDVNNVRAGKPAPLRWNGRAKEYRCIKGGPEYLYIRDSENLERRSKREQGTTIMTAVVACFRVREGVEDGCCRS